MKKETALGICLFLLSLSLTVVPILAAFSAHGWDITATVMPEGGDIDSLRKDLMGNFGAMENLFKPLQFSIIDAYTYKVSVPITSTVDVAMRLDQISGDVFCEKHPNVRIASLSLTPVIIQPRETKMIEITIKLTQDGFDHAAGHVGEGETQLNVSIQNLEAKSYGITLKYTKALQVTIPLR